MWNHAIYKESVQMHKDLNTGNGEQVVNDVIEVAKILKTYKIPGLTRAANSIIKNAEHLKAKPERLCDANINIILDKLYDLADAYRIWLDPFNAQSKNY